MKCTNLSFRKLLYEILLFSLLNLSSASLADPSGIHPRHSPGELLTSEVPGG